MNYNINSKVNLNNGIEMPSFGLGVYKAGKGSESITAVEHAIKTGYRLIDTASIYGNEREVGIAVKNSELPRKDIFITTKLWNSDHGYDRTLKAIEESLKELQMDYVDLYLIHWPVKSKRKETWRAMIEIQRSGRTRAIGVSNFMIHHLEELLDDSDVIPSVNQVEFSPFLYQKKLLEFCNENNIQLEAYTPLTRGKRFDDPVIKEISSKHSKTPAQILISWCLEKEVVVISKSSNKKRIEENADVFNFNLDEEDLNKLDRLDEEFRVSWDPSEIE